MNEESIRFQIEELVDEAYQTLYIKTMDKDLDINEQVISISDREIYKISFNEIQKVLSKYVRQ